MPRGPEITDEVKRFIAEVSTEHPDWTAKEVAGEVQGRLRRLGHQIRPGWPGLSIVQIKLKEMRDRKMREEPLGVDSAWSIGRLAEYPIAPLAVPKVLAIQDLRAGHEPLTIREARWVGHLRAVIEDTTELAVWAALYAEREKACEQAGIKKDTSDIDRCVRTGHVTMLFYFQWLGRQDWVPDSYKKQVAEEQARQYEDALGVKAERPTLTTNGWLLYADSLNQVSYREGETKDIPKESRQLYVLISRLLAKAGGKTFSSPGYYTDQVEMLKTGESRTIPLESAPEPLLSGGHPSAGLAEELQKFNDPEFTEFVCKDVGGKLPEVISRIAGGRENVKSEHDHRGGSK